MANITPQEEKQIQEMRKRTGVYGCIDKRETQQEAIERTESEVKAGLLRLSEMRNNGKRKTRR